MKLKPLYVCFLLGSTGLLAHDSAMAQSYPQGTVIIEQRSLPTASNRALVLWMINPQRSDPIPKGDPYTCPDETRGDAYWGPTRVSLVRVPEGKVINTIEIRDPHFPEEDTLDIPYAIRPGYYYLVNSRNARRASKPTILNYRDLKGDGEAAEFVLYDAPFCMGLQTTLVGYSRRQDRVIQYPLEIEYSRDKESWHEESLWVDYVFSEKPVAPGHYRFQVDYRGRGGSLESFDVAYDRSSERFRGTCTVSDK